MKNTELTKLLLVVALALGVLIVFMGYPKIKRHIQEQLRPTNMIRHALPRDVPDIRRMPQLNKPFSDPDDRRDDDRRRNDRRRNDRRDDDWRYEYPIIPRAF